MDKNTTAGCSPIQPPLIKRLEIRPSSASLTSKLCESPISPGVKLWQSAFQKLRSHSTKLDPWKDFKLDSVVTKSAIRHRYSAIKKKWIKDDIYIKLEDTPFDRGAMRECFRMKKMPDNGDWYQASNYVAKRYISNVNNSVYLDDVRLQMEAKLWCEAFNRQNPPKKVDVFQMAVIEILPDAATSPQACSENKRRSSVTTLNAAVTCAKSESSFYHIERYMDGEYRKYNSNSGFVDTKLRNTPQAFSHFTFERSGHRLLVVDIQGVGDLYTDPQIHTADGLGYNDGNLGVRGMALFFHSHRCNPLCEYLGLSPFDLSAHETSTLLEASLTVEYEVSVDHESDNDDCDADNDDDDDDNNDENSENSLSVRGSSTRLERANLFLQARSQPRKRSLSFGMIPTSCTMSASSSASSRQHIYGPTVVKDLEFLCTPRFRTHSGSVNSFPDVPFCHSVAASHSGFHPSKRQEGASRLRQTSGDSGIFASSCHPPSHRLPSDDFPLSDRLLAFDRDDECPFPESCQSFNWPPDGGCGDDEFDACLADLQSCSPISIQSQLLKPPVNRLMRTVSESSDIDDFEIGRPLNNNLHQVMHETHKPSSAVHPSNLDQEIGQSILGQIHHELARLHEAGRFLKRPGGWSKTGLGALNFSQDHDEENDDSGIEQIDWESVVFHERNAAQLGCLEALIIMAHYYLGLPTQLLSDCPITPREEDLCLGVDYLWRSSEGGDRRCMILLARYLDASVVFSDNGIQTIIDVSDPNTLKSALNLRTTPKEDFLLLLSRKTSLPIPAAAAVHLGGGVWAEAVAWYKRAVENAGVSVAGSPPSPLDEGCDAEGRYDAAEDLSPVHRLLARMAEMYMVGGHGLTCDFSIAGDLFTQAAESAMQLSDGRLASKYFEIAEVAYGNME